MCFSASKRIVDYKRLYPSFACFIIQRKDIIIKRRFDSVSGYIGK